MRDRQHAHELADLGRQGRHLQLPLRELPAVPADRPVDAGRGRGQPPAGVGRVGPEPRIGDGVVIGHATACQP